MSINLPPFYNRHGSEVLFLPGLVRELRIAMRDIQRTVPHQRLETLDPHTGIEKLTGKGMSKGMKGIPLMGETGCNGQDYLELLIGVYSHLSSGFVNKYTFRE
jgi:hypothetical protein